MNGQFIRPLPKIEIRTSANVSLFHYIDSACRWDSFVGDHTARHFKESVQIDAQVSRWMEGYRAIRTEFGWDKEGDLLNWAFNDFSDPSEFQLLLPLINQLAGVKRNDGSSTKEYVQAASTHVTLLSAEIEEQLFKTEVINLFNKLYEIFGCRNAPLIPTYLTFSPDLFSHQGGAHGSAVYCEVLPGQPQAIEEAVKVTIHELIHSIFQTYSFFKSQTSSDGTARYSPSKEWIYDGRSGVAHVLDEAVALASCQILLFDIRPENEIKRLSSFTTSESSTLQVIWRVASEISLFLMSFVRESLSAEECRARILEVGDNLEKCDLMNRPSAVLQS